MVFMCQVVTFTLISIQKTNSKLNTAINQYMKQLTYYKLMQNNKFHIKTRVPDTIGNLKTDLIGIPQKNCMKDRLIIKIQCS